MRFRTYGFPYGLGQCAASRETAQRLESGQRSEGVGQAVRYFPLLYFCRGFGFDPVNANAASTFPRHSSGIATSLRTASNQLVFLSSCGYFKATKRFYSVPTFHRRDLTYVADWIAVHPGGD
jgi:hypothetical protein